MPIMSKTPGKELPARSVREIEEMIGTIEQYLKQTKKVLDRIEKDIIELKKEGSIQREKDEIVYIQKDPAEKIGMKL